jgi:hypothetical protein
MCPSCQRYQKRYQRQMCGQFTLTACLAHQHAKRRPLDNLMTLIYNEITLNKTLVVLEGAASSMLGLLKSANLALAFFLELGVLVALGYWGFHTGHGLVAKIGFGIGAPIVAVAVWALFGAPNAVWHLHGPWRWALYVVFFGSAVVALAAASQRFLGVAFALIFILNAVLIAVWAQ